MKFKSPVIALTAALLFGALGSPVVAQEFPPAKAVTLYVGFPPGGANDIAARIIGKKLSENIGQKIVVDNKPGAGGNIVTNVVATGPTDGSVILLGSIGPLSIASHLMKIPYDPVKDLAPLAMGGSFPNVLLVSPESGIKSLKDLVDLAKKEPGKLTFASTGAGSASHLQGELFNQRAGVDIVHIPYKGGGAATVDVIGNRVTVYYSALPSAAPHIRSGKLIPLAVTSEQRADIFPDIPTIAESGYPGFDARNWYAFVASAKTPPAILDRWNQEIVKVITDKEVKAALLAQGLTLEPGTRDDLAKYIAKESETWGKIIKDRNITIQQ
ncbi:tripartite tricarboxylate transporter substrate binding protein [Zwartia sp.]|uniref:Bug family tripartite tricarboxylate transporter substrate binding protein n=1 Tax=Zwartia sp. TaxID=2978004 RepID=UPI0027214330|nr:tripartite tricarboxylate transporter substrate binding protein [Zwartia sp.]MDO9023340.1 tripartite tricarboxylate transporter substrate binding protein [Zwartia sp.]